MRHLFLSLLAAAAFAGFSVASAAPHATPATTNAMTNAYPLFFTGLAPLDTEQHRHLKLPTARKNVAFASTANLVPITVAEAGLAMRHYPMVFLPEGDQLTLVVLTGLPGEGNRFIDKQGQWRADQYIPAYVRGYPFIALRPSEKTEPILAFDPNAADIKAGKGQPLFQPDGSPTELLKGIVAFHTEYRLLAERTLAMSRQLKEAGVLEEGNLQLQPANGGEAQHIGGFYIINEQKLRALPEAELKKLMQADALGLAYAQMFSMGSLGNVFAPRAAASPEPTSEAVAKPKARQTRKQKED